MFRLPLFRRLSLPFIVAALLAGFTALGNDPWWTVQGVGSSSILNVRVSPFYAQIDALGVSPTVPNALVLGSISRILLIVTTIGLTLTAIRPKSEWKKPVFWLSLSSLVELYLSFALLLHAVQVTILQAYGTIPPISGNTVLPGRIIGLDTSTYLDPTIASTFTIPFFLGIISIIVLGGTETMRFILHPKLELIASELMKGLSGVYLSPPYQHAWFTSTDQSLNPLNLDPDEVTDDELASSFERLLERMQPGGLVSVILPAWATGLNERLVRVVPWTGFHLEKSELIYRAPGKPENELVFRKPASLRRSIQLLETEELSTPIEITDLSSARVEAPPVAEVIDEPVWASSKLPRQETAMVKSAIGIIERRREPVQYKELLNEVYMDLLDKKVGFESARQIETTLLKHSGRELTVIEDIDELTAKSVKKWWLGEVGILDEKTRSPNPWRRLSVAKIHLPKVKKYLGRLYKRHDSGYKPTRRVEED